MLDEKDLEIKELLSAQDYLKKKLSDKGNEIESYKETFDRLLKESIVRENSGKGNNEKVSLDKYEALLNEYKEEQDRGYELIKV